MKYGGLKALLLMVMTQTGAGIRCYRLREQGPVFAGITGTRSE
jgi:hypothetical protein